MAKKQNKKPEKTEKVEVTNSISDIAKKLNKKYGAIVIKSGEDIRPIRKVSTGEPAMNHVYGGGVAIGMIHERIGKEHTGKTRDLLVILSKFQKYCFNCNTDESIKAEWRLDKDRYPVLVSCTCSKCKNPKTCVQVYVDYEGTADPKYMDFFGIDKKGIVYVAPYLPTMLINLVEAFLYTEGIGLILVDSVGIISSDKEIENAAEDNKMNFGANVLNSAVRKWQAAFNKQSNMEESSPTTLAVVNRMYETKGIYSTSVVQGGGGLKHGKGTSIMSSIVADGKAIDEKTKKVLGIHRRLKNIKNKTGMPYRVALDYLNLDVNSPIGYCQTDVIAQYIDFAIEYKVIEMKGAWYYYKDQKWQGRANMEEALKEVPKLYEALKKEVEKYLN